jgi:hypothetical protein
MHKRRKKRMRARGDVVATLEPNRFVPAERAFRARVRSRAFRSRPPPCRNPRRPPG